ncbi:hypothetical protein CTAM01_17007 [Colletotrichum tamarilloi]|uniref:Transposase n=1 Tax=Colletotrichum tamarilloi TaxID=1209934 RepID=A0ABQ9QGV5_9PEZI|nr:uncharacterized protein CTAM01_17007 [Colletotrichum tamarilloi]KAK1466598.1 hypothetical protein CTAM01_17007 [Colletotrichum tamarilloi]
MKFAQQKIRHSFCIGKAARKAAFERDTRWSRR